MSEPNKKIVKSRPGVPNAPEDGGVFDLPRSMARDAGGVADPSAAKDIDPAIQPNRIPVDSYNSPIDDNPPF